MNIGYACGVNGLSLKCLNYLLQFTTPKLLLISKGNSEEFNNIIKENNIPCIVGKDFRKKENIKLIKNLNIDYLLSIHFPYIFSKNEIDIINRGIINLHPAFLPLNRGFHTHNWAILDNTLAGATLHWIDENIDTGDIIDQKSVVVNIEDTTNDIYRKVSIVEFELFTKNLNNILNDKVTSIKQNCSQSTNHFKKELKQIKELKLNETYNFRILLDRLRACTTNNYKEGCYFILDNNKYYMQINITNEK